LAGDASARRYYRVVGSGVPAVLALYPDSFEPRGFPFLEVRELLASFDLPVPTLLDVDGERGVLLLEDLGDRTLQETLMGGGDAASLYRVVLSQLETLQRRAELGPRTASCFAVAFDTEKLSWELHYFLKHFVEGFRGLSLSVSDRTILAESFHTLASEIASFPRVLCHRDFHSRNLMLHGGRVYWIDFQDARLGPATYDLVSLLKDAYVALPEALSQELFERFRSEACPGEERAAFRYRFDTVALQRTLKALGTFGFMTRERGSEVYRPYIPGTLERVRTNPRFADFQGLREVLGKHIEELQ
jgi:aminoglycoside/choline kinase family phosphotransferase